MGMHFVDTLVIALIALAIFGPKTLQSIAKSAGKSAAQAKDMKDKLMAELPMEEVTKFREGIPQVPLNSRDAMRMLVTSEKPAAADEAVKTVTPKTDVGA